MTGPYDGVGVHLVSGPQGGHWAWVALEVEPARPAAVDAAEAARREQVWLAARWNVTEPTRFEVRYLALPGSEWLTCVLLGQVFDADRNTAVQRALALRDQLAATPDHIRATPVADPAAVAYLLAPLQPHPGGMVEIRKDLAWSVCSRPERRVCFAISPYAAGGNWQPMWEQLLAAPAGTLVGVCVEPYQIGPGERAALAALASQYARLAEDNTSPVSPVRFPPDPLAVVAQPLYHAAVRRYIDRAFRVRVSVAAAAPVPPDVAERVAATVTPPSPGSGFAGGAVAIRPAPAELNTAWSNITTMDLAWLNHSYQQSAPPGSLGPAERFLSEIADLAETAAAFRLPYEIPGRRPLFDGPQRRQAATRGVRAPFTVVIAHDSVDADAAARLDARLRAAGLEPWRADVDVLAGADRRLELRRSIRQSRHVVVCLSTISVGRAGDLQRQLRLALDVADEMPEGRIFIIPVLLDEGCPLPSRIDHLEPVRFYRPEGPERLLRALGVSSDQAPTSSS